MRDALDEFIDDINARLANTKTFHFVLKIIILELARTKDINSKLSSDILYPIAKEKVFNHLGSNLSNIFPDLVNDCIIYRDMKSNISEYQLTEEICAKLKGIELWQQLQREVENNKTGYGQFDFNLQNNDRKHRSQKRAQSKIIETEGEKSEKTREMAIARKKHKNSPGAADFFKPVFIETNNNNKPEAEQELNDEQYQISQEELEQCFQSHVFKKLKHLMLKEENLVNYFNKALSVEEKDILNFIIAFTIAREVKDWISAKTIEIYFVTRINKFNIVDCLNELDEYSYISYNQQGNTVCLDQCWLKYCFPVLKNGSFFEQKTASAFTGPNPDLAQPASRSSIIL